MWNFALVGVVSVYFQKGVPRALTQSYLIAVSVIMAWILTKLDASLPALLGCSVLLVTGVLKWSDVTRDHAAWDSFI